MIKTRVIPVILWSGIGAVKTVQFRRPPRFVGSMMQQIRVYERRDVDEIVILDIDATRVGRGPRINEIREFASHLFCPLTVGGGVRSVEDVGDLLRNGADKVVIKTAGPRVIAEASKKFGAQAIVAAIDIMDNEAWVAALIAQGAAQRGAGEILLTSIIRDGTMTGYDLESIRSITGAVSIPVVANGGAGSPEHMGEAIKAGAHAVAASSLFLFTETTPADCKTYLSSQGIPVRLP